MEIIKFIKFLVFWNSIVETMVISAFCKQIEMEICNYIFWNFLNVSEL